MFKPSGGKKGDEGKQTQRHGHNHVSLQKGNSTEFEGLKISFTRFNLGAETMRAMSEGKDFQMGAVLTIEKDGNTEEVELIRKVESGKVSFSSFESEELNVRIDLENLTADNVEIALSTLDGTETKEVQTSVSSEVLTVNASIKPFINLVWAGVAVLVVGFFIAVSRRLNESLIKS